MKKDYLRVPITMPPDMFEGLESLSIKSKITGGRKLANTEMVRAAVNVLLKSGVDISGCKDEEEVEKRLLKLMKKPQLY